MMPQLILMRHVWRHLRSSTRFITTPIITILNWNEPFEIMCDVSDFAIGVVLEQRHDKKFKAIYYASRTLNEAQENYTTTEKEMLAIVFSYDKFKPYIIGSKSSFTLIKQLFSI